MNFILSVMSYSIGPVYVIWLGIINIHLFCTFTKSYICEEAGEVLLFFFWVCSRFYIFSAAFTCCVISLDCTPLHHAGLALESNSKRVIKLICR